APPERSAGLVALDQIGNLEQGRRHVASFAGSQQRLFSPGASGTTGGSSVAHLASASLQRGWKRQPAVHSSGSGTLPWIGVSSAAALSSRGIARKSARV